nr:CdaR family protein [Lysinibacillus timonensis]
MDKLFDSPWILRITALVLAILMFFYVKSLMGEGITSTTNNHVDILTDVPLEVYYDTDNLIVDGLPDTVDVTIEGPIQLVLQAKLQKDYKIFVDLSDKLIGEHRVKVQHEAFSDKLSVKINPEYINVTIEEKVTAELRVEPEMNHSLIDEAYVLNNMTAEPGTVFVTGAKSVIGSINYIKATVTGNPGINASFEQDADVKVLDSNLNKLDVLVEPSTVRVKVDISEYSRDLPISISPVGTPVEGVTVERLTSATESVQVFGQKSIIDGLSELVVEFDVSVIEESGEYEVSLNVPNGASRLSTETIIVLATVSKVETIVDEETAEDIESTNEEPQTEDTIGNNNENNSESNTENNTENNAETESNV